MSMLNLKYLFDNTNLAEMLIHNWDYDQESLELFKYYRISSNAIYPFQSQGQTQLLRFAPTIEKNKENLLAELEFIAYLRDHNYGVLESVGSKNNEELVEVPTPWGDYYASVFKRVSGVQLNQTDYSDHVIFSYGKALGKLHQLSSAYIPTQSRRWSYIEVLDWIQEILLDYPAEAAALKEVDLLRLYFASIPKNTSNFGLIHYDFEFDNVFYDEATNSCNAIDFDDSMYHWYAMDIEQALDSLQDEVSSESYSQKEQCFLDGYKTEFTISDDLSMLLPACRRFANLYGYVRILRSIKEEWPNEPEWCIKLRAKLKRALEGNSAGFGIPVESQYTAG